jgi:hypothetical protein
VHIISDVVYALNPAQFVLLGLSRYVSICIRIKHEFGELSELQYRGYAPIFGELASALFPRLDSAHYCTVRYHDHYAQLDLNP